jgi:hypothetical protein
MLYAKVNTVVLTAVGRWTPDRSTQLALEKRMSLWQDTNTHRYTVYSQAKFITACKARTVSRSVARSHGEEGV